MPQPLPDPLHALAEATDAASAVIQGVAEGQWGAPSPCEDWTVEDVVRHLVEGTERLAAALQQADAGGTSQVADAARSYAERHRAAAAAMLTGFARPGALTAPVTVPAGTLPGAVVVQLRIVEALVHGWDIATGAQQQMQVSDDLVAVADRSTRELLAAMPPHRRPFAPSTEPPLGASPLDRLAALLGRRVPGAETLP